MEHAGGSRRLDQRSKILRQIRSERQDQGNNRLGSNSNTRRTTRMPWEDKRSGSTPLVKFLKRLISLLYRLFRSCRQKFHSSAAGAVFEAQVLGLQNTEAVNFAGNPALAIPIPLQDKTVPVTSLQLVGPRLSEAELLNAGRLIEAKRSRPDRQVNSRETRVHATDTSEGG